MDAVEWVFLFCGKEHCKRDEAMGKTLLEQDVFCAGGGCLHR
ncbi:hypothetical protein CPTB_00772 [Corynebacterium pseudotuberculosis]|nr:Hypothetical protein Cp3995_0232 [Corynebacterium pseudotuberculosis 3/99-5]AIG08828.1 hypothetical protein CPTB_00772 [Corynebacterium pseudotuberculosis]